MRDKRYIQREINALGLPLIVSQIFQGTSSRPELFYRCESPYKSWVDRSGFPEHLLPLWECGTTVTAFDLSERMFCKLDLESPDEPHFRVKEFDGVVADVLIDLWEDEVEDDTLSDLAAQFGFSRWPSLLSALEKGPTNDYETWRNALRTNIETK